MDERFPLDSALVLAPSPAEGGANGLLQAWEILERLRLRVDLVTLSACDTALGEERAGEGIVGLVRAFQYAGARSVLASLWSVADTSTAELMDRFYRHFRGGMSTVDALRAAQLEMIRGPATAPRGTGEGGTSPFVDTSRPFHWAAFELVGD